MAPTPTAHSTATPHSYRGPSDETRNLAYLESVVRDVVAPGKPVVLAEFGWCGGAKLTINGGLHSPADEAAQARWCRGAVETTWGLATGWLNWGFYEHPESRDVSQLTGLLTSAGPAQGVVARVSKPGGRVRAKTAGAGARAATTGAASYGRTLITAFSTALFVISLTESALPLSRWWVMGWAAPHVINDWGTPEAIFLDRTTGEMLMCDARNGYVTIFDSLGIERFALHTTVWM